MPKIYTDEMVEFIVSNRKDGRSAENIAFLFLEKYDKDVSVDTVYRILRKKKFKKERIFSDEMLKYITDNYKDKSSIPGITKYLQKHYRTDIDNSQVSRKIFYLNLEKSECRPNSHDDGYIKYISKIQKVKDTLECGDHVVIPYKTDDVARAKKTKVTGIYPHIITVIINGRTASFQWQDIISVMKAEQSS